jgi:hypothetical protein
MTIESPTLVSKAMLDELQDELDAALKPDKQAQSRKPKRDGAGRFLPGVSGNVKGRPAVKRLSEWLRAMGQEPAKAGDPTRAEALAKLLWAQALEGDRFAIGTILDRVEGRPLNVEEVDALAAQADESAPILLPKGGPWDSIQSPKEEAPR